MIIMVESSNLGQRYLCKRVKIRSSTRFLLSGSIKKISGRRKDPGTRFNSSAP